MHSIQIFYMNGQKQLDEVTHDSWDRQRWLQEAADSCTSYFSCILVYLNLRPSNKISKILALVLTSSLISFKSHLVELLLFHQASGAWASTLVADCSQKNSMLTLL